jgi:hypothetical protein
MKTWAENKRRQMEAIGAAELAEMFQMIVKLYELEEQRQTVHPGHAEQPFADSRDRSMNLSA